MFSAVFILGARQVGKTTLARSIRPDWRYFDLENENHYAQITHDVHFFFEANPSQLILDEAQIYPQLFNALRGVIDANRNQVGRFLITGSSNPLLLDHVSESLAGRVAFVELGTLKVNEYFERPMSRFYHLFENKLSKKALQFEHELISSDKVQHVWLRGGYPEPLIKRDPYFYNQWMENYFNTYINKDIADLFSRLSRPTYRRFISMLAKLSSTILNKSDLARALEVSEGSVRQYLTIAQATFLWNELQSYEKSIFKTIVKMPKGYMRDSGVLHHLLSIHSIEDLYANPVVGHSFEAFVIDEVIKGLNATMVTNWEANYYRTRKGSEVDLILHGPFGVLPIEIKYGSKTAFDQIKTLIEFVRANKLLFGILLNQSKEAKWLCPEVFQLPVGYL